MHTKMQYNLTWDPWIESWRQNRAGLYTSKKMIRRDLALWCVPSCRCVWPWFGGGGDEGSYNVCIGVQPYTVRYAATAWTMDWMLKVISSLKLVCGLDFDNLLGPPSIITSVKRAPCLKRISVWLKVKQTFLSIIIIIIIIIILLQSVWYLVR